MDGLHGHFNFATKINIYLSEQDIKVFFETNRSLQLGRIGNGKLRTDFGVFIKKNRLPNTLYL